jgi:hypothetical protein
LQEHTPFLQLIAMGRGARARPCSIYKDEADEVTDDHKFIAKSMRLSIIDW